MKQFTCDMPAYLRERGGQRIGWGEEDRAREKMKKDRKIGRGREIKRAEGPEMSYKESE